MNHRRSIAMLAAACVLAASCGGDDGPGPQEAALELDGRATVTTPEGVTETLTDDATLAFGDVVLLDEGTAVVELAAGQRYELRAGEIGSELVIASPPELVSGDALVVGGFPATIAHDLATVSAHGPLKVTAGVPSVSAYAGAARISGTGDLEHLPALREVVLTPSAAPQPLVYDAGDSWDRRYLGESIAFGQRLEALARGYTGDLQAGGGRSVSFFESVIPALAEEREFGADLLGDRPPGETLVGAAIAAQGRTGTFRERWASIFSFRDAGAAWGLVALDQGVSSAPLLDTIELAIDGTPAAPDDESAPTTATTDASPPPTSSGGATTSTTATTATTTTTTTAPPPGGLLEPVTDPVQQLLDEVLGALGLL